MEFIVKAQRFPYRIKKSNFSFEIVKKALCEKLREVYDDLLILNIANFLVITFESLTTMVNST